jgi:Asp-tRNA(Asn)/Glu-tRNA(Gln) amidotransferase A subunit family amidase
VAASEPPLSPRFAFVKSPVWDQADAVTSDAFGELVEFLGEAAMEVELGESFERAIELHRTVVEVEMAHNLHRDYEKGGDKLSAPLRRIIERGRARLAIDYAAALAGIAPLNEGLNDLFNEYDAILTPAAPGEAPLGLESTGNPIFCTIWTYLGAPAITLPLLRTESGLPLGVQLVGRRGNDARLLRTARWLVKNVERISYRGRRQATVMDSKPAGRAGKRK